MRYLSHFIREKNCCYSGFDLFGCSSSTGCRISSMEEKGIRSQVQFLLQVCSSSFLCNASESSVTVLVNDLMV